MTRDEAVAIIQQQLGFRTDLTATIITNLQLAQVMLEAAPTKPWWLVSEEMTATTTSGESRLAVPTMLTEIDQAALRYIPEDDEDNPISLRKDDYDVLLENYNGGNDEGPPEAYALLGNYFRIFPKPDDVYTLKIIVNERDATLSSNITNGFLTWVPYLLIGTAGKLLAGALRDREAMSNFSRMEAEGAMLLHRLNTAREEANTSPQMGGPH